MEHEGKQKKPYRGIWIPFLIIVLVPVIAFVIFYNIIRYNFQADHIIHVYTAFFFSGIVGLAFDLICVFSGFLSDLIRATKERIKETHELFGLFSKDGFKYYIDSFIHDGGPLFWLFILIAIFHLVMSIMGLVTFLDWYNAKEGSILLAIM